MLRLAEHAFGRTYPRAVVLQWLRTFYRRFFAQQFKRSCLPDGPKVGSVSLSPRATGACLRRVAALCWRSWRGWRGWSDVNIYADLFLTFAKIGVCTFGGGYAMLPILQRELVEKRGWATEEELSDYFAIGQCTPGIIAVNTATS